MFSSVSLTKWRQNDYRTAKMLRPRKTRSTSYFKIEIEFQIYPGKKFFEPVFSIWVDFKSIKKNSSPKIAPETQRALKHYISLLRNSRVEIFSKTSHFFLFFCVHWLFSRCLLALFSWYLQCLAARKSNVFSSNTLLAITQNNCLPSKQNAHKNWGEIIP